MDNYWILLLLQPILCFQQYKIILTITHTIIINHMQLAHYLSQVLFHKYIIQIFNQKYITIDLLTV